MSTAARAGDAPVQGRGKSSWKLFPVFEQDSSAERERPRRTVVAFLVGVNVKELTRTTREVCTHTPTNS